MEGRIWARAGSAIHADEPLTILSSGLLLLLGSPGAAALGSGVVSLRAAVAVGGSRLEGLPKGGLDLLCFCCCLFLLACFAFFFPFSLACC